MAISDFIEPSYLKHLLILTILGMSVILVALFALLVIHKIYVSRRDKKSRKLTMAYAEAITRKVFSGDSVLRMPKRRKEFEAFGNALIAMLSDVSGKVESELINLAREARLDEYYKEKANSFFVGRRLVAVEALGLLKMPETKPFFYSILEMNEDKDTTARAVLGLSLICTDEVDLKIINNVLKGPLSISSKFNEYIFTNIIKSFERNEKSDQLIRFIQALKGDPTIPLLLKRDVIEACGSAPFYAAVNTIKEYFSYFQDSAEMKIACVRAIGRLGGRDGCSLISACMDDEDWRVRSQAARSARFCGNEVVAQLKRCLHDTNYYVRLNAAESLTRLGYCGLTVLYEELKSPDRFTVDVAQYMLRKAGCNV